jgi:hypothetical protein
MGSPEVELFGFKKLVATKRDNVMKEIGEFSYWERLSVTQHRIILIGITSESYTNSNTIVAYEK